MTLCRRKTKTRLWPFYKRNCSPLGVAQVPSFVYYYAQPVSKVWKQFRRQFTQLLDGKYIYRLGIQESRSACRSYMQKNAERSEEGCIFLNYL